MKVTIEIELDVPDGPPRETKQIVSNTLYMVLAYIDEEGLKWTDDQPIIGPGSDGKLRIHCA